MTQLKTKPSIDLVGNLDHVGNLNPSEKIRAICANIKTLRDEMVAAFPERDEMIDACIDSAITGEHILSLGPPGVAKSAVARAFAGAIKSDYWQLTFTKYTSPDEVFGPTSLKAMEQDINRRNPARRLPEAIVAIFEEVFKGNSAVLNACLGALNERTWDDDGMVKKIPLRFAVMNSNEIPKKGDGLDAMHDRVTSRVWVGDIVDDDNFDAVVWGDDKTPEMKTKIPVADLDLLWSHAKDIDIDDTAMKGLRDIREAIKKIGIVVSPRRYKKASKIVRAFAARHGDTKVMPAHLVVLKRVCWNKPEEMGAVHRIVDDHAGAWKADVKEINESLMEILKDLNIDNHKFTTDFASKLRKKIREVEKLSADLVADGQCNVVAVAAQREVDKITQIVSTARAQILTKTELHLS